MFGSNTITPTSSSSASGTAIAACFGGVMSTVRIVCETHPASTKRTPATTAPDSAEVIAGFDRRLLAGFVATVFLPELFFEHRIRLVHRGFAKLSGDDVVVARVFDVARRARDVGVALRRHRRNRRSGRDRQATRIGHPAAAAAGTASHAARHGTTAAGTRACFARGTAAAFRVRSAGALCACARLFRSAGTFVGA